MASILGGVWREESLIKTLYISLRLAHSLVNSFTCRSTQTCLLTPLVSHLLSQSLTKPAPSDSLGRGTMASCELKEEQVWP